MTEEELPFERRNIPELKQTQSKKKRDYGNKYMANKTSISVDKSLLKQLDSIQIQKNFKTKGDLIEYFVNLENTFHPELETIFECKKCGRSVNALKDMNIDRLVHRDLCKDTQCTGSIITKQKIKTEVHPDTTEQHSDTTEQKGNYRIVDEDHIEVELKDGGTKVIKVEDFDARLYNLPIKRIQ